jgi:phosphoglycerate dehydrogenase-like enzyme
MLIKIVGLHAQNAPRLRALLGPDHEVQALDSFPPSGKIVADVVISNSISSEEAARLSCALVHVPGAGSEQIAMHALPSGIAVCNVHGHEVPIAEFSLHAMLEHQLKLWLYPQRLDGEAWATAYSSRAMHDEIKGKTLVIVGFGHIGQEISQRAKAFGIHVIAVTRRGHPDRSRLADEYVSVSELDTVLARANVLQLCCPLDDSTRDLIGERQLSILPSHALIVNVARAEVINEKALYEYLKTHSHSRAALDVWYQYPKKGDNPVTPSRWPLHDLPNVRATPHISGITPQLLERRYAVMASNILRMKDGESLNNLIYRAS